MGHYQMHSWVILPNSRPSPPHPSGEPVEAARLAPSGQCQTSQLAAQTNRPMLPIIRFGVRRNSKRSGSGYIENNPVAAGLAARPEESEWSSAGRPARPPQAEGLPHLEPR